LSDNNNALAIVGQKAITTGRVGLGSSLFQSRPSTIELVPKSTRQEGAIPGTFRRVDNNERLGTSDENGNIVKDEIRVVIIGDPESHREYYLNDGKTYNKEQKICFSTDNIQPHSFAKVPQAMYCETCPMGDINWKKWREGGKTPNLLPPCSKFWHLFIAERNTQVAYYLNVKGKSVKLFEDAMRMQMTPLLDRIDSNAVMINKSRGYKLNKNTGAFEFVGEGQATAPPEPRPNVYDIAFTIYSNRKDGDIVMGFKDFMRMKPEDRLEFGGLYDDFVNRKKAQKAAPAMSEEAQGDAAVTEEIEGEYMDSPAVSTGGKDEPITI
jgi:hypothetical protein